MRKKFIFRRRRSHKLLLSFAIVIMVVTLSVLSYSSYAEVGYTSRGKTDKTMGCEIVYTVPESEIELEFGTADSAPKGYGLVRRCENPEIICYYISEARNIFCQFKRFDKTRTKGNLRPE